MHATVSVLWLTICSSDMNARRYLALTGGIGGSKLALGLSKILNADELGFIVNTGDDFEHLGLHISPDIDTLLYTLADLNNTETGWGRRDETWHFMSTLADLGGETWFKLGDKDLALNIQRSSLLDGGASLNEVSTQLAKSIFAAKGAAKIDGQECGRRYLRQHEPTLAPGHDRNCDR